MPVPIGSNNSAACRLENMGNSRGLKEIPTEEYSPEKAGVGGSIPSLATMFSISYKPPQSGFGPNWSQFGSQGFISQPGSEGERPAVPFGSVGYAINALNATARWWP